ncbi:hypothetical protein SCHPADRAFT_748502 [Schizopora paradoxa]|uniref:Uncharacterized protein n=1 Tax=Schizopora paradoxa TaxID=27342 RepID=A0A0H2QZ60_9AGAM|nr:hypothetical protein SCHPADRAFT_748502 [Schizopora paradoxa]
MDACEVARRTSIRPHIVDADLSPQLSPRSYITRCRRRNTTTTVPLAQAACDAVMQRTHTRRLSLPPSSTSLPSSQYVPTSPTRVVDTCSRRGEHHARIEARHHDNTKTGVHSSSLSICPRRRKRRIAGFTYRSTALARVRSIPTSSTSIAEEGRVGKGTSGRSVQREEIVRQRSIATAEDDAETCAARSRRARELLASSRSIPTSSIQEPPPSFADTRTQPASIVPLTHNPHALSLNIARGLSIHTYII